MSLIESGENLKTCRVPFDHDGAAIQRAINEKIISDQMEADFNSFYLSLSDGCNKVIEKIKNEEIFEGNEKSVDVEVVESGFIHRWNTMDPNEILTTRYPDSTESYPEKLSVDVGRALNDSIAWHSLVSKCNERNLNIEPIFPIEYEKGFYARISRTNKNVSSTLNKN